MCASRGQPGSRLPRTSSDSTYCPGILGVIKFIGFISEWMPGPLLGAGELGLERKEKITEAQSGREAYSKQAIRPSMGNTERREQDLCKQCGLPWDGGGKGTVDSTGPQGEAGPSSCPHLPSTCGGLRSCA